MGRRGFWLVLLLWSAWPAARAAERPAPRLEASLIVEGSIDVDRTGAVVGYALEHRDRLEPAVAGLIERSVPGWRSATPDMPSDAAVVHEAMSLRLIARALDAGQYEVAIRSAAFGRDRPGEALRARRMDPPVFPLAAARSGVGGIAYVVVKVDRDGHVADSVVEQVNLRVLGSDAALAAWRSMFADAARSAVRRWRFEVPQRGPRAGDPYWSARVPLDFTPFGAKRHDPYAWSPYLPGPRAAIPWRSGQEEAGADAVAGGRLAMLDSTLRLLTPLDAP